MHIINKTIEPTKTVKYPGVSLDSALEFYIHVQKIISKLNSCLRTLHSLLHKINKILIYTSIIRPLITYAAPVLAMTSETKKSNSTTPKQMLKTNIDSKQIQDNSRITQTNGHTD